MGEGHILLSSYFNKRDWILLFWEREKERERECSFLSILISSPFQFPFISNTNYIKNTLHNIPPSFLNYRFSNPPPFSFSLFRKVFIISPLSSLLNIYIYLSEKKKKRCVFSNLYGCMKRHISSPSPLLCQKTLMPSLLSFSYWFT